MYSIGVIAVVASLNNILKVGDEMQRYCNITYLSYTSKENLVYIYEQNKDRFDGFLFGGPYTYYLLKELVPEITKPYAYFSIEDRDYFRMIARLSVTRPGLDFHRVYIDKPSFPVDFQSIFEEPDVPRIIEETDPNQSYENSWEDNLSVYRQVYSSGKADLIITRFGSMEEQLKQDGIPHVFLFPSPETMLETFWQLLTRIQENQQENLSCIGILAPDSEHDCTDKNLTILLDALKQFNQKNNGIILIYPGSDRIELSTTSAVVKGMTDDYSFCPLLQFMRRKLHFPVSFGVGIAESTVLAHERAELALQTARKHGGFVSYYCLNNGYIVGPLAGGQNPESSALRAQQEISLHEQQIRLYLQQNDKDLISAGELAEVLDMTTRNAARILKQLEGDGRMLVYQKQDASRRGRPIKYYRFID